MDECPARQLSQLIYYLGWSHLRRVLDWINGFAGVEVLLIEQDKHSKIKEYNFFVKHIFIKSNQPYNRSWSFNVGLKYSTTDIVVFTDSDIIIENEHFIICIKPILYDAKIDFYFTKKNSEKRFIR
jgi:glycosyltransferase involved in cell wall biosynthesis